MNIDEKQRFSLGFIFDKNFEKVLLQKKIKWPETPELHFLAGKLNGIGGHVEENESPCDCMIRECEEETGLKIFKWEYFCFMDFEYGDIYCFYSIVDNFYKSKQKDGYCCLEKIYRNIEGEELYDFWIKNGKQTLHGNYIDLPHMSNLQWLIPMALNHAQKIDNSRVFAVKELYNKE